MSDNPNPLLTEAFRLMVAGYSVIPLGNDKRPRITSWKPYQTTAAAEDQILQWWTTWPDANVGIVTGRVSGITVIDIDAYKFGTVSVNTFPATYTVQTGNGGTHLYYTYAEGLTISAGAYPQYPNLDIRNDGGYIVAPPSLTAYEKDGKLQGGAYTVLHNVPLAPFPSELFPAEKVQKPLSTLVGVTTGSRNDSLASVIGKMLRVESEKKWFSEVLPAVEKINATYTPPLPHDELLATFNSIVNLERGGRAAYSGGNEEENAIRQEFKKSKVEGTYMLAEYIVKKFEIVTVGEREFEMYVYRDGMYFQAVNEIIYPEMQRILGRAITRSAKLETFSKIVGMTMRSRDVFASVPLNLINLTNGVYDRDTKTLLPHSPAYYFTHQFPIIYNPEATCTLTEQFLTDILDDEQRTIIEEWMGYFFHRIYSIKKAIIFVGEGDTGKTTLLNIITALLGKQNISSVSLQKMTGDRFAASSLFEKHGNLVDELSARDISETGNFKIATGGGSISGERKYGNMFMFENFSKLTFATNRIPDVKDFNDEPYFNRWIVLHFEQPIKKKIPNFAATLTTPQELSGLFNLAMVGLNRLLAQGKFSYDKNALDTKRDMMRSGSSIAQFAAERLVVELGSEMTKEDMYDSYTKFCAERGVAAETIKMLGTKLPYYVPYMTEGKMTMSMGPARVRCWRNVIIKKDGSSGAPDPFDEYQKTTV